MCVLLPLLKQAIKLLLSLRHTEPKRWIKQQTEQSTVPSLEQCFGMGNKWFYFVFSIHTENGAVLSETSIYHVNNSVYVF